MKTFTFSLMATFCTLFAFGQHLSDHSLPAQSRPASQVFLSSDRAQVASIEKTDYIMNAFRETEADRCGHAKKVRTIGIVLASVGGGLLIGGVALLVVGVQTESNDLNNGGDGTVGLPLIAGGAVCTIFGVGGTAAGIPLAIIGSVKAHKYCGGNRDRSYMELSTKGNGLALNF